MGKFLWCSIMFSNTAQKMKFLIKDFFSKCDQIRRKLQIWSHLLKKSLMENSTFCVNADVKYKGFQRCRSSRLQMFFKIVVLKNFSIFTRKHVLQSLFNKVAGLEGLQLSYKKTQCRYFPVNIVIFLAAL